MRSLCKEFKINHRNSTAYSAQMNEAVEAVNKNIKRILRKMIDNHKHWHEKLPFALLGYRTTIRTSTGATSYFLVYGNECVIPAEVEIPSVTIIKDAELIRTSTGAMPYFLVYGNEVVIPAEVEIPSLRIIQEEELSDAKWIQARSENLALIDGRRINAVCLGQFYQTRIARAFNKKVRPRHFSPGQLVLKRICPNQDEAKGKFSQNWQGPYIVSRVLAGGPHTCRNGWGSLAQIYQLRCCEEILHLSLSYALCS
ncbi:hypothetical protein AABB24_026266 [Solanum stoloniferum]|uniref:Integrase catalytic domain-containing protein n=1 Tax=Solanum stoloniferum TaxID=62892 RepID=A0ABD2SE61_9SOLN